MRTRFKAALAGPDPVFAPLCLDPLAARLASDAGFAAGYLSGGALGFQYAVGEALLSYTEIADVARRITARSDLPLIIDGGVGFGDAVHTARATALFEATGAVAVEYEDQVAPKRLHHHIGVEHLVFPDGLWCRLCIKQFEQPVLQHLLLALRAQREELELALQLLHLHVRN